MFSAIDYLNQNKLTTTEKGAVAHRKDGLVKEKQIDSKEISGPMVALWNKAILGQDRILLHQNIQDVVNEIQQLEKYSQFDQAKKLKVMLITMWAETRDCRGKTGGKGWREGAHWMFLRLSREFPETMMSLFHLYPKYGSWKDLTRLIVIISEDIKNGVVPKNCEIYSRITDEIYNMWSEQLLIDSQNLTKHKNSNKDTKCELSLCAKYIPKEKKSVDKILKVTKKLATKMFPKLAKKSIGSALKKLRQLYSPINKAIKTTEIFMAACKFSEIDFKFVPGRCLNKHKKVS